MRRKVRSRERWVPVIAVGLLSLVPWLMTAGEVVQSADEAATVAPLTPREKAVHVLDRLAFGARPGEVDEVLDAGVDRWIEQQLHPQSIDDSAVEQDLRRYKTLGMSDETLFDQYEKPLLEARRSRKKVEGQEEPSEQDLDQMKQQLREQMGPGWNPRQPLAELTAARITRAVESNRQLEEVLVDFWVNHFNIYARKGPERVMITSFERDVIRPNLWGHFDDLLLATAKSPAMLFYLDNVRSVAEMDQRSALGQRLTGAESPMLRRSGSRGRGASLRSGSRDTEARMRRIRELQNAGLNENYARELMELHTLGVDGGYTQKDVTELARVLTGWSMRGFEEGGGFVFRSMLHDSGSKRVLGHDFPAGGGMDEGEQMLRILARSPATARHLAAELCVRFVSDDPPPALVDRVAAVYLRSGGDLRKTVEAVITSPEFFDPANFRTKVKSPFEFTVSALRAMGATTDGRFVAQQLAEMGEPLYLCQPPNRLLRSGRRLGQQRCADGPAQLCGRRCLGTGPGRSDDESSRRGPQSAPRRA